MKQGDIHGFHAWNMRVFCVSLRRPRCKHEVGFHSSTQPSQPVRQTSNCGDPRRDRAQFRAFLETNDIFPGSFHGGNEERERVLVAPIDSTGVGDSVVLE